MAEEAVLRLRTFRPAGFTATVDARIRDEIGPALTAHDGLVAFYPGRRGVDPNPERVLVTVWDSPGALDAAAAPGGPLRLDDDLGAGTTESLPLVIDLRDDDAPAPPAVLRVFRGVIRDGSVDPYLGAARDGALADIDAGRGAVGFFVAMTGPSTFLAVSAWADWDRISAATGGSVDRPIATRNIHLLVAGHAAHYEILPHAVAVPERRPTLVD